MLVTKLLVIFCINIFKIRNNFKRSDYEWFVKTEGKPQVYHGVNYGDKYTFDTIRAMSWISDASFVKDFLDKISNPPMFKFACNTFLSQHKLSLVSIECTITSLIKVDQNHFKETQL